MAKGPARQRLDEAVDTAKAGRVATGQDQWHNASERLGKVADHMRQAAHLGLDIKGDAGKKMFETMLDSANRLDRRADQMEKGKGALRDTTAAIMMARAARDEIDTALPPLEPEQFSPPQGYDDLPAWRQTEMRQNHGETQSGLVEKREQEREDAARQVAQDFEKDYQPPIKVMQQIYGYEPPPPAPPGDVPAPTFAPGGGSSRQSGTYTGPRGDGGPGDHGPGDHGPGDDGPDGDGPGDLGPGGSGGDGGSGGSGDDVTGPPTSPWVEIPGSYGDAGPGSAGGSGPSVSPAVLGAGAGVVAAGALGAAARGGAASAGASALRNLTSRGGPLGGTARGAGPVLGRGAGGAGSPTGARGSGAAARGAGGVRSGAGTGAGRGAGTGAGGRGRGAGGRAGGTGVGGKRGRSKDTEEQRGERDLFDDGSDWIDDEDAAPGVID